nr:hypothetical protein [Tanacetum cinerariifolium]
MNASTSSQPLQLPSASRREGRPEVTLPPRKRLGIALGPGYEAGESLSAAARPAGGLRADYGFVATMDREIMRDPKRESERQLLAGQLNMLFRDRRAYAYTRHLMETEARLSREAWVRSTDASDLICGEVMSLRTTVLSQMTEIRELHAADCRRQIVISKMLRADHRRSTEIIGLRTVLQGQMTEIRELHAADCRRQIVISKMLRADHRRSTEIIGLRTVLQGQVIALQGQVIALQEHVTALQGQQGLAGGPT